MKENKTNNEIAKGLILLFVSVAIGTLMMQFLDNFVFNVWLSRIAGAITSAVVAVILYRVFFKV